MNEIVVLSGKGGTGKTSLVAAMLAYCEDLVIADCDVDAPDLHLLLKGPKCSDVPFYGLERPQLIKANCIGCGLCTDKCHFGCRIEEGLLMDNCEGCGVCEYVCPVNAIHMEEAQVGQILHHKIAKGDFIYGRLIPGEETSGKLVAAVRRKANEVAKAKDVKMLLVDGAPGIACNVISSATGASHIIIVAEPSMSGLHDLKRVHKLVKNFRSSLSVVINKVDLSPDSADLIRAYCQENELFLALEIPYNKGIVESINKLILPPEYDEEFYEQIGFGDFLKSIGCL